MNPRTTLSGKDPEPGHEGAPAPAPIDPSTGFVRPVRRSYKHVGAPISGTMRDLTPEESERYASQGYVKYEEYPPERSPHLGRFWTQAQLDRRGCQSVTAMPQAIAETYARDPKSYGQTFCVQCAAYLPVEEFVWLDDGTRVGT